MGEANDSPAVTDHQLWVNLSALGDGNVFAYLPELMKKMLDDEDGCFDDDFLDVVLPSNDTWQTKIYYKLVEKQRLFGSKEKMLDPLLEEKQVKLHDWNIVPKQKHVCCKLTERSKHKAKKIGPGPITWTISDIAKAGCLLSSPPVETSFDDEQEMRRVYTLIYDVFRYKNVLTEALNDVGFFEIFPMLESNTPYVWLLFYDLYHRNFKKRESSIINQATFLFERVGITFAENALWTQRVKLAAAVSRLRIKHNALSLSDLLPKHLKDERITMQSKTNPVTCWINVKKVEDPNAFCKELEQTFNLKAVKSFEDLDTGSFRWDSHCPQIINFHNCMRPQIARSDFVKKHQLVVQDKSFCFGPATFGKLIADLELSGSVIQTHVNSPRSTAYLANLLCQNDKIKRLLAFSAGQRKREYDDYLNKLGLKNVEIYSDRLIDLPSDASYMEEVVAVFATPPNSYSAVSDPIDLVCSRGGDLSMLEVLTESEDSAEGKERVASVLEEQRKTLKFAMSRPQIQFVLYETHSELEAENTGMVQKALRDVNRIAKLQHAHLNGKTFFDPSKYPIQIEINNNENLELKVGDVLTEGSEPEVKVPVEKLPQGDILENVKVPDTDIFDVPELPSLCPSDTRCLDYQKEGCFLALIQRKEVIKLDDKYMIQMAENRGLFGSGAENNPSKVKVAKKKPDRHEKPQPKKRRRVKESEIERIAAPTHTYLRRTKPIETQICPKCRSNEGPAENHQYKKWWNETTNHILALKSSLVRQKLIPPKTKETSSKAVVDTLVRSSKKVDEVVVKANLNKRIPVFPKLKLTREVNYEKIQLPLTVTSVEFPSMMINSNCYKYYVN